MNEIGYQNVTETTSILRQPIVARATSAFIKDFANASTPLSFNRHSESGGENSML
jgi:hypothetical protein